MGSELQRMAYAHPRLAVGGAVLMAYMSLVRYLRYRRINALMKKYPDPTIPLRDREVACEISATVLNWDFPFLTEVALEFALFKTYAIPSISKILASTQQFTHDVLKRADDTVLITLEMTQSFARNEKRILIEGQEDSAAREEDARREATATERLNFIHGHYPIKQEDFLYTLALFIREPSSFVDRFEWRKMTELEKNGMYAIWSHHGRNMKIENIPESFDKISEWAEEYERSHAVYAKSNVAIAESTTNLLLSLAPSILHPFGRGAVSVLLTPSLRRAFGHDDPSKGMVVLVHSMLHLRRLFIKYLMLPRRLPLVRTASRADERGIYVPVFHKYAPVYSDGYRVEDLGPSKFLGKCPVSFHPSGVTPPLGHKPVSMQGRELKKEV